LKGWAETIEYCGGTFSESYTLIPARASNGAILTQAQRQKLARDKTLAIVFIRGVDPTRYGTLITDLANQFSMGFDNYPTDLTAAYGLVVNYKTPANTRSTNQATPIQAETTSAITFVNTAAVAGTNGVVHNGITCFNCQETGHYACWKKK